MSTFLALALVGGLSACAGDDALGQRARDNGERNIQIGDGAIEQIGTDRRGAPVELSGELLDGSAWSRTRQGAGKVVVVNLWASWCGPCEAEAPHLVRAATELTAAHPDVVFLGIDFGESPATGAAAAQRQGLPYPSLSDPNRAAGVWLQGKVSNPPSTLVLDRQGRIAARINGAITSPTTLKNLVDDVAAEKA
ncbi:TlpA family protein disulfide reductase [Agilicoccus flavus]|uniref:TlpA family protein disulfide reductase n=1 Tax=Agilicoccus flavus TaxID=2775968 RepID=UPI001CF6CD0C|nr:TlpA disulfide reductase family protein [Agilicoccus flavus]